MGNHFNCDLCFHHENAYKNHQNLTFPPQYPSLRLETQKDHQYLTLSSFQHLSALHQQKREQENEDNFIFSQQQQPSLRFLQSKNNEVYLTVDQKWSLTLQKNPQFSIKIDQVYSQISNNKQANEPWSKKIVRRSAYDNKKIQILFKKKIPMIGKYFFQVELVSYVPNKRCDFTIGIVSYEFAKDKLHSRDSLHEQSYTYIQKRNIFDERQADSTIQLNLRFKVQVNRQEQQITFFINDKLERKQKMKQNLQHAMLLVPYLQTQYQGVVLGWKTIMKRLVTSNNILQTIGEEASSVVSF